MTEIKRCFLLGRKVMTNLDSILKSRDVTLPTKAHLVKDMAFSVAVYRCELDHREGWVPKNWCFQTVVLEKTLESPLDCKEIKPTNTKRNQPWTVPARTDAKAEAPILGPLNVKNWHTGKDPDAKKDWAKDEKEATEYETIGWHHRLNGHEFEQTLGGSEGQGTLVCCSSWGRK